VYVVLWVIRRRGWLDYIYVYSGARVVADIICRPLRIFLFRLDTSGGGVMRPIACGFRTENKIERMKPMKCPYLEAQQYCKPFGTYQDGYQLKTYCLSPDGKWIKCPNYEQHQKNQK